MGAKFRQEFGQGCIGRVVLGHTMDPAHPELESKLQRLPLADTFDKKDVEGLLRNLKYLDQARPRETHKIGLLYTGLEEEQSSILRLEVGSEQYRAFVNGLGWQVPLDTHQGFNGKLDTHLTTGTHAPYFADANREVVFHVPTQMPTAPNDPQQIHKKRHIGNDQVQVIYCEHTRDFRAETISSQFNDAHIVLYPLAHSRFRVQTLTKKELYGPLCNNMVVHQSMIAELVRRTAVNADKMVRRAQYGHNKPFVKRQEILDESMTKFAAQITPAELCSCLARFPRQVEDA
eukprot:c12452_g1_i1.p1 GENE.c12452_g1_i1~~c12452_g1_i1.p1  ORF type:complete len:289 (+),score=75.65 c12452_g1_i1:166-1032(+)